MLFYYNLSYVLLSMAQGGGNTPHGSRKKECHGYNNKERKNGREEDGQEAEQRPEEGHGQEDQGRDPCTAFKKAHQRREEALSYRKGQVEMARRKANMSGISNPLIVGTTKRRRMTRAQAMNSASHSVANTGARASVKPLTNATRAKYLNLASKKKQRNLTPLMP